MAWRRPGDKPLFEPMMINLVTHICVTRPQWVTASSTHRYLPGLLSHTSSPCVTTSDRSSSRVIQIEFHPLQAHWGFLMIRLICICIQRSITGLILGLRPASERRRYFVTASLFGWVQAWADSRLVPSQWETALLCNDVSHWLGTSLKSALYYIHHPHGNASNCTRQSQCLLRWKIMKHDRSTKAEISSYLVKHFLTSCTWASRRLKSPTDRLLV